MREGLARLKQTRQALGAQVMMQVADWAGPALLTLGGRFALRMSPYNLLVTNVPGPQFPLYMLGARLLAAYPEVPLFENQALGIALFSYDGQLYWGFNADWDLLPDLHLFVEEVQNSFAELLKAATPAHIEGCTRRKHDVSSVMLLDGASVRRAQKSSKRPLRRSARPARAWEGNREMAIQTPVRAHARKSA